MVQAEVADRIVAPPGSRTYGVPSVKAAWYADARRAGASAGRCSGPCPTSTPPSCVSSGAIRRRRRRRARRRSPSSTRRSLSVARRCGPRSPAGRGHPIAPTPRSAPRASTRRCEASGSTVAQFAAIAEHTPGAAAVTAVHVRAPGKINIALRVGSTRARRLSPAGHGVPGGQPLRGRGGRGRRPHHASPSPVAAPTRCPPTRPISPCERRCCSPRRQRRPPVSASRSPRGCRLRVAWPVARPTRPPPCSPATCSGTPASHARSSASSPPSSAPTCRSRSPGRRRSGSGAATCSPRRWRGAGSPGCSRSPRWGCRRRRCSASGTSDTPSPSSRPRSIPTSCTPSSRATHERSRHIWSTTCRRRRWSCGRSCRMSSTRSPRRRRSRRWYRAAGPRWRRWPPAPRTRSSIADAVRAAGVADEVLVVTGPALGARLVEPVRGETD